MTSRAQRRRLARREQKQKKAEDRLEAKGQKPGEIQLVNPVTQHFEAFIAGNATKCPAVVRQGSKIGQSLAICGAGPSLREHVDRLEGVTDVWGINSAAPWLVENEHPVTHGFTIDQTPTMLKEWHRRYPLKYLLASTVHPHLTDYLLGHDVTFFHNFVGLNKPPVEWEDEAGETRTMMYEDWLYTILYEPTVRCGSGLNGVTRAVDLAYYMGYDRIIVLGADCAMHATSVVPDGLEAGSPAFVRWLEENTEFHADGGSAVTNGQSALILQGDIDGRLWTTKPDLMVTAVVLARWLQSGEVPGLEIVGDTLPNALRDKDDEFFDRLPGLKTSRGEVLKV